MKVLAAPGLRCPMEHKPHKYIPDTGDGVDVPESPFYLRLIGDGSLVLAPEPKKKKEVKGNGK
jgi:hypothetical protein